MHVALFQLIPTDPHFQCCTFVECSVFAWDSPVVGNVLAVKPLAEGEALSFCSFLVSLIPRVWFSLLDKRDVVLLPTAFRSLRPGFSQSPPYFHVSGSTRKVRLRIYYAVTLESSAIP